MCHTEIRQVLDGKTPENTYTFQITTIVPFQGLGSGQSTIQNHVSCSLYPDLPQNMKPPEQFEREKPAEHHGSSSHSGPAVFSECRKQPQSFVGSVDRTAALKRRKFSAGLLITHSLPPTPTPTHTPPASHQFKPCFAFKFKTGRKSWH